MKTKVCTKCGVDEMKGYCNLEKKKYDYVIEIQQGLLRVYSLQKRMWFGWREIDSTLDESKCYEWAKKYELIIHYKA